MKTILHLCCADCLLRYLIACNYDLPPQCQTFYQIKPPFNSNITKTPLRLHLFFHNPNIYPKSEYNARLQAVKEIAHLLNLPLTIADYQPQDYFSLPACQKQLANYSAFSPIRCQQCQNLRLSHTFKFIQQKFPSSTFSTTMLASHYLDHQQIASLGKNLSPNFFTPTFLLPLSSIKTSGFFKQNYCGCLFSLYHKTQEKYLTTPPKN